MNKRDGGRIWWVLTILMIAAAAGLAGYFIGMERGREAGEASVTKKIPPMKKVGSQAELETPKKEEVIVSGKIKDSEPLLEDEEDYCTQIEDGVRDFFRYLDKKNYVQHLEADMDTYDRFTRLIKVLSSRPPIPAGEGIDSRIITRNIFYFSRLLDKNNLILIRQIVRNETDTLEINLDMFYKWLMLGERCPDPEGIRPPLDALYQHAGFFLNTIGGRTYLFRRPVGVRLLVSYYSLLIIHEADKQGKNNYGIDIFPEIAPLIEEMSIYPDFHFRDEYLRQLGSIQSYYIQKR